MGAAREQDGHNEEWVELGNRLGRVREQEEDALICRSVRRRENRMKEAPCYRNKMS
jgi:hypothetical protein